MVLSRIHRTAGRSFRWQQWLLLSAIALVGGAVTWWTGWTCLDRQPAVTGAPLIIPRLVVGLTAIGVALTVMIAAAWFRKDPVNGGAARSRWQRMAVAAALLVLAAASTVYRGADRYLQDLHRPGDGAYGTGLAKAGYPSETRDQIRAAITVWSAYAGGSARGPAVVPQPDQTDGDQQPFEQRVADDRSPSGRRQAAPLAVLAFALWVDSALLVPAYGVLLLLLIVSVNRGKSPASEMQREEANSNEVQPSGPRSDDHPSDPVRRIDRLGSAIVLLLIVTLLSDWLENAVTLWAVHAAWPEVGAAQSVTVVVGGGLATVQAIVLMVAALLKTVGLTLSVAYLLWRAIPRLMEAEPDSPTRSPHPAERQPHTPTRLRLHGAMRTITALRVPLLTVLAYAVLVRMSQVQETLWSWSDYPVVAAFGLALSLLLAFGVFWLGDRFIRHEDFIASGSQSVKRSGYLIAGALALLPVVSIVIAMGNNTLTGNAWKSLIPFAIVLLLLGLAAAMQWGAAADGKSWSHQPIRPPGTGRSWLPAVLGAVIPAMLGLALLSAYTPVLLFATLSGSSTGRHWLLIVVGLALLGMAGWMSVGLTSKPATAARSTATHAEAGSSAVFWSVVVLGGLLLWSGAALALAQSDWGIERLAPSVGAIGIIAFVLLLIVAIVGGLIALVTLLAPPPPPLRVLHIAQLPVLSILALWWLAGELAPPDDPFHDVRPVQVHAVQKDSDGRVPVQTGESLAAAFAQWRWQNCLVAPSLPPEALDPAQAPVIPLILVATDGGASFAAGWTAYVADRVLGYGRPPACTGTDPAELAPNGLPRATRVFAASGVSGGSVGLATYAARALDPAAGQDRELCTDKLVGAQPCTATEATPHRPRCGPRPGPRVGDHDGWIRTRLGRCESLSATVAWLLLVERPRSFVHTGVRRDRAAVLARNWEQLWGRDGPRPTADGQRAGRAAGAPHTGDPTRRPAPPDIFALRESERAWESRWSELVGDSPTTRRDLTDADVADLYQRLAPTNRPRMPLLLLNGASVESGCRFNGSTLAADGREGIQPTGRCLSPSKLEAPAGAVLPATIDLASLLCEGQDMPLATVAILSSRFPFVSPSGHLSLPEACRPAGGGITPETYVVDGGYLDNTGMSTTLGLLHGLAPLIDEHNRDPRSRALVAPYVIQIVSGYQEPAGPGATPSNPQLLTPLLAALATYGSHQSIATQEVQLLQSRPYVVGPASAPPAAGAVQPVAVCGDGERYALFSLRAYPGPRAQSTWSLSTVAFNGLVGQFIDGSLLSLQKVDRWFTLQAPRQLLPPRPVGTGTAATAVASGGCDRS